MLHLDTRWVSGYTRCFLPKRRIILLGITVHLRIISGFEKLIFKICCVNHPVSCCGIGLYVGAFYRDDGSSKYL
jgi:hypothetical protein